MTGHLLRFSGYPIVLRGCALPRLHHHLSPTPRPHDARPVPQHTALPLARAAGEATAGASFSRSHRQGGLHAARPGSPSVATRDRAAPLTSRATCLSSSQHDAAATAITVP